MADHDAGTFLDVKAPGNSTISGTSAAMLTKLGWGKAR